MSYMDGPIANQNIRYYLHVTNNILTSKTFEFRIDVLEILFHFRNAKTVWKQCEN